MKTRTKVLISIIAVVLSVALVTTILLLTYGKSVNQLVRTVELTSKGLDVRETLNSFENTKYSKNGTTTIITASKKINADELSNIDNISLNKDEIETLSKGTIKYNVSYDTESNNVSLIATAQFPDGKLEVDEIIGQAFINENNEIDAVMNIDGEGVLLSEMRASGMIENCGWFSRLMKGLAVIATVVAVGALVVATAGALAPVAVGAAIGVSATVVASTIVPAAIIVGYNASLIAAMTIGVAITAAVWEANFPGIQHITTTLPTTGQKVEYLQDDLEIILKAVVASVIAAIKKNKKDPKKYFRVTQLNSSKKGTIIEVARDGSISGYTRSEMASYMRSQYWNSITAEAIDAQTVVKEAFPQYSTVLHGKDLYHYHPKDPNISGNGGVLFQDPKYPNDPSKKVSVHSYCYIKPIEPPADGKFPKFDLLPIITPYLNFIK